MPIFGEAHIDLAVFLHSFSRMGLAMSVLNFIHVDSPLPSHSLA